MKRVLHIADPHLRSDNCASMAGWRQVAAFVQAAPPALLINTGDLVFDEPNDRSDQRLAGDCQRSLGVEVLSLPGNHDIGDGPPREDGPSESLLDAFRAEHGEPHWVRVLDEWALVGVNAMLFGAGASSEAAEWAWLEAALAAQQGRPVALFMHKPPLLISPSEDVAGSAAMPAAARGRLWSLVRRHGVSLVGCGHRHEYRSILLDGVVVVWAPTTSGLLDETTPPLPPHAYPGLVEYAFEGRSVVFRPIVFEAPR